MKKLLLGLSAMALVAGSAQANDRLVRCIKNLQKVEIALQSTQEDLNQCRINNTPNNRPEMRRLKRELRQTREELRLCRQTVPTPDFGETARLRRELKQARQDLRLAQDDNRFLRNSNDDLRIRLEECEGQNPPYPNNNGYFCSAACTSSNGKVDLRYMGGAEAMFELEAESQAISKTQSDYRCSWGVKKVSCAAQSFEAANYCVAACATSSGKPDLRYSKGASGRSVVEAEFNALKETQKAYKCSWGVKISNCN